MKIFVSMVLASVVAVGSAVAADDSKWLRPAEVPAPADNKITPERVELGTLLYFDTRLSRDNTVSCATCHHPDLGWSDNTAKAIGVEGRQGPRNSPTVLNTAYQFHQFWDGRAKSLEEQALGPIQADVEMDMELPVLISRLKGIDGYVTMFEKAYPGEGITEDTLAKAIATFERTVVSTDADFDRYIRGDKNAMSDDAKKGFELFKGKARCVDCHDGFNFTDGSYHNLALGDADEGRYRLKRRAAWFHAFKTPTLRDVTKSGPYFHDGSAKTLEEVTTVCGNGGRFPHDPRKSTFINDNGLDRTEVKQLVAFLEALEGDPLPITVPTSFPK